MHREILLGASIALAVVLFWWGLWNLLDMLTAWVHPAIIYIVGIVVALFVLYLDGFHLKELE